MTYKLIVFSFIAFLLVSCHPKENEKTYSLSILYQNSYDPINPSIYGDYHSSMICVLGFELIGNNIQFYRHNKQGRFLAEKQLSKDSVNLYQNLVNHLYSKKNRSCFKDSTIYCGLSMYCGATYVPCISTKDSIEVKLIAESVSTGSIKNCLGSLEYASYSDTIFTDLKWKKLEKTEFPKFPIYAEQFANLNIYQPPPPPPIPEFEGVKFEPPKI